MNYLSDFFFAITWTSVLIGASIFLGIFSSQPRNRVVHSREATPGPLQQKPANEILARTRPALNAAKVIGKNILGLFLVALGVVLSLPGVPGQGLLTILLGIMLLDFPGPGPSGTEIVKQTEYCEHDQPFARKIW